MSFKIENLTNSPVLLRLNNGRTLHLAPRTTSSDIMDVEVNQNAKVQKLKDRHVITLHEVKKKEQPAAGPKGEKAKSTKKKEKVEPTEE